MAASKDPNETPIGSPAGPPARLGFGWLLLISFVLYHLGYVVDSTLRWTDPFQGFLNGVFHALLFGIGWCMTLLPWNLLIYGLYRWRNWRRFRTQWTLAPALLMLVTSLGYLILHPPTAESRFRHFAKAELPRDLRGLHYAFSGGGITDYDDLYYFETSPKEVERLIRELDLNPETRYGADGFEIPMIRALPGCPDPESWVNWSLYKRHHQGWFFYLLTDETQTKVYISVSCI